MFFVPSILEVFSASYLEAFVSKRVLFVADKGFAKDICRDGAIYINSLNFKETAEKIYRIVTNQEIQKNIINNSVSMLDNFLTQEERIEKIIDTIKETLK
jgi:glycosyltransferase involved in cell wall biosynthesis